MASLSAFIITKNEEGRIAKAINSIKDIANEVIVVDSGSTDRTVEIAKSLGATVVFNAWPGYVKQKAFGEGLCKHDWILNIDADEELSIELQNEISHIFESNVENRYKAYAVDVTIIHRFEQKIRKYAPCNTVIRLYNRHHACFANVVGTTTHDAVRLNDDVTRRDVYRLNEPVYHYSGASIEQLVNKANFYSGEQANDLFACGRRISNVRIMTEFFGAFLKAFFIRRYFIFGFDGFIDSVIFAFARFLRIAKTREKEKEGELNYEKN